MKTISLLQPWASLVAIGAKKIETRSWSTNYRGPLLIHASKGFSKQQKELCWSEPFRSTLIQAGYRLSFDNMPFGMIIAQCIMTDCVQVIGSVDDTEADLKNGRIVEGDELVYGNYAIGRYAWFLADVQIYEVPIPAKGKLGLWEFEGGKSNETF